ncbi:hypothetical protein HGA91_01760 [candidate division WWE3 bacterium]|nr:hypothetical protein [candidate division WWE3 bacterium]
MSDPMQKLEPLARVNWSEVPVEVVAACVNMAITRIRGLHPGFNEGFNAISIPEDPKDLAGWETAVEQLTTWAESLSPGLDFADAVGLVLLACMDVAAQRGGVAMFINLTIAVGSCNEEQAGVFASACVSKLFLYLR